MDTLFNINDAPLLKRAIQFERETKQKGHRNGSLGYVAIEILYYLIEIEQSTGTWAIPPKSKICMDLGRSKSAIDSALLALKKHNFLNTKTET